MVNVEPIDTTQQPISDDQELAKVLAGVDQQADAVSSDVALPSVPPVADEPVVEEPAPALPDPIATPEPVVTTPVASGLSGDLSALKQEALSELRPLVDKLDVSPEEKFDTYLLLLRSTDDKDLIAPAHEAAKGIADEARRAQALLDIIKEIDFLSAPKE